jgi:hypothetical protein
MDTKRMGEAFQAFGLDVDVDDLIRSSLHGQRYASGEKLWFDAFACLISPKFAKKCFSLDVENSKREKLEWWQTSGSGDGEAWLDQSEVWNSSRPTKHLVLSPPTVTADARSCGTADGMSMSTTAKSLRAVEDSFVADIISDRRDVEIKSMNSVGSPRMTSPQILISAEAPVFSGPRNPGNSVSSTEPARVEVSLEQSAILHEPAAEVHEAPPNVSQKSIQHSVLCSEQNSHKRRSSFLDRMQRDSVQRQARAASAPLQRDRTSCDFVVPLPEPFFNRPPNPSLEWRDHRTDPAPQHVRVDLRPPFDVRPSSCDISSKANLTKSSRPRTVATSLPIIGPAVIARPATRDELKTVPRAAEFMDRWLSGGELKVRRKK